MSEKKQPVDLGLLEEDDEFEEFPAEGNRQAARWDRGLRWGGVGPALWVCGDELCPAARIPARPPGVQASGSESR